MTPKLSNLNIFLGYWNENMNQNFRFNNPKQCLNWIIFVSFCSCHLAIKIATMLILWKCKKFMQKSIFPQKSLCITAKTCIHKFKISNAIISTPVAIQNLLQKQKMLHFSWTIRIYNFFIVFFSSGLAF